MKRNSKPRRMKTKTETENDAVSSSGMFGDKLSKAIASFTLSSSTDPDEIDASTNPMRKSEVWNEPTYNKSKPVPAPLDLQQILDLEHPTLLEDNNININVEIGSKFFSDPMRIYPMYSCPRGHALIINNQEFDNPDIYPFRKGAHVDGYNLEKLFTQLGFKVKSYKNLKRNATLKKLIEFSEVAETADMMVVCIMSHGLEHGKIVSADGFSIDTENDVLRRFNNDYCPELKGMPKFFIIQACRGEEQDYGIDCSPKGKSPVDNYITDAVPIRGRTISDRKLKEHSWEDMLIAYSTLPGYVSNRDHYRGTWFIESICKVFMEYAKDMNLRDMLDEVGLVLSMYESESGTKQSFNYDARHFYKKLYFNPGINIDPKDQWKHSSSPQFDSMMAQEQRETAEGLQEASGTSRKRTISVKNFFAK